MTFRIAASLTALALLAAPAYAAEAQKDQSTLLERLFTPSKPTADAQTSVSADTQRATPLPGKEPRSVNNLHRAHKERLRTQGR